MIQTTLPKIDILRRITETGLVAVLRADSADEAMRVADAVLAGGCPAIEVTFTVPGAHKVIETLASRYATDELILGAGTVLDPETARIAIISGATYIVSPAINADTIRLCNRYQTPVMPGAMTIKDVIEAMELGADIIKIFPGQTFGPDFLQAIKGPLPHAPLMPTGGVDLANVAKWIRAGAVAVGVGSILTAGAKSGDFNAVTNTTKLFIDGIKRAREQ
jgi:2-dehydro-3-deoxyphosphogluconate aldolase/(4S)-4-hydroxy-2-oxoglutarate aldolase